MAGFFWRKKFLAISFGILLAFTNPFIINRLYYWWEPQPAVVEKKFKLAVVLTGMTIPQIQVPGQLQMGSGSERIIEPLRLYHQGQVEAILISGGSGSLTHPELAESPALAALSSDLRVSDGDLYIESKSRNTHQNALFSSKLIDSLGFKPENILLVTSALHIDRAMGCFKKQGLFPTPYPVDFNARPLNTIESLTPSASALTQWEYLLHEWFGLAAYKAAGYI